ncbi:MAG: hypothetical protein WAO02_13395 [Verrucomicrobiia bacterium]
MKIISIVPAVCLGLLAGCSSHKPAKAAKPEAPSASQILEASDDFKIEAAVYGYLLEKHPWGSGDYAEIFLEGNDAQIAALIRKFPHHVPPLKAVGQAQLGPNQAPMDKDTGKPGLLLSAKAVGPTNGVSEAIGTWNGGGAASGTAAFVLMEADGGWTIQSVQ